MCCAANFYQSLQLAVEEVSARGASHGVYSADRPYRWYDLAALEPQQTLKVLNDRIQAIVVAGDNYMAFAVSNP